MQVIGGWYGRYVVLDADDTGSMDSRHWPREATLNNLELRERVARPGSITTQSLVIITNQSLVSPRLFKREHEQKSLLARARLLGNFIAIIFCLPRHNVGTVQRVG